MFLSQPLHGSTHAKVLLLPCRSAGPSWHRPRAFSAPNAADLASLKAHAPPELSRASEPISTPDEPVRAVASDTDVALPADSGKPGRYYTLKPLQGGGVHPCLAKARVQHAHIGRTNIDQIVRTKHCMYDSLPA